MTHQKNRSRPRDQRTGTNATVLLSWYCLGIMLRTHFKLVSHDSWAPIERIPHLWEWKEKTTTGGTESRIIPSCAWLHTKKSLQDFPCQLSSVDLSLLIDSSLSTFAKGPKITPTTLNSRVQLFHTYQNLKKTTPPFPYLRVSVGG